MANRCTIVGVISSAVADLDAAVTRLDLAVDDRDLAAVLALRDRLDARIATRSTRWTPLPCGTWWGRRR